MKFIDDQFDTILEVTGSVHDLEISIKGEGKKLFIWLSNDISLLLGREVQRIAEYQIKAEKERQEKERLQKEKRDLKRALKMQAKQPPC